MLRDGIRKRVSITVRNKEIGEENKKLGFIQRQETPRFRFQSVSCRKIEEDHKVSNSRSLKRFGCYIYRSQTPEATNQNVSGSRRRRASSRAWSNKTRLLKGVILLCCHSRPEFNLPLASLTQGASLSTTPLPSTSNLFLSHFSPYSIGSDFAFSRRLTCTVDHKGRRLIFRPERHPNWLLVAH